MSAISRFLILMCVGGLCTGSVVVKWDVAAAAIAILSYTLAAHIYLTDLRSAP